MAEPATEPAAGVRQRRTLADLPAPTPEQARRIVALLEGRDRRATPVRPPPGPVEAHPIATAIVERVTTTPSSTDVDHQIAAALLRASSALAEAAALLVSCRPAQPPAVAGLGELLRIDQVADITGLSINTLRAWRQSGKGPQATRLGGRLVWDRAEVEAWIHAQFTEGRSPATS